MQCLFGDFDENSSFSQAFKENTPSFLLRCSVTAEYTASWLLKSKKMPPASPVAFLNRLKSTFDDLPLGYGLLLAARTQALVFLKCHLFRNLIFFSLPLNLPCAFLVFDPAILPAPIRPGSMLVLPVPMPHIYDRAVISWEISHTPF